MYIFQRMIIANATFPVVLVGSISMQKSQQD